MKTEHDIENIFSTSKPALDQASRARIWSQIESKIARGEAKPSPFLFTYIPRKAISPVLILVIVASTAGIAFASETARPGDLLYPVDRALESARLTVALDEDEKDVLVRSFSEERLRELRAIIEEESHERTFVREDTAEFIESEAVRSLEIEVDMFTDVTVIKVELNDKKTVFTTPHDSQLEIVNAIQARFPVLSEEQILLALTFEREDRASRPKDRGEVSFTDEGSVRVGTALAEVVSFIEASEKNNDDAERFFREIADEVEGLNIKLDDERVHIRGDKKRFEWKSENDEDDDKEEKRIEYWEGSSRVRIEEKNGEVRIDVKERDDDMRNEEEDARVEEWKDVRSDDDDDSDDDREYEDEDTEDNSGKGSGNEDESDDEEESEDEHEDEDKDHEDEDTEDNSGKGSEDELE